MSSLFPYTISLSLFDSLSTAQQIIIFALMLTTNNPIRNSLLYLIGLIGAYFACGLFGYLAIDQLHNFINTYLPSTKNLSNSNYYLTELGTGILMLIIGIWFYRKKRFAPPSMSQNLMVAKLRSMNGRIAFAIGAIISITSFPFSIPYIIALGKYASLNLNFSAAIGNISMYNFGYALPMLIIFIIYLFVRNNSTNLSNTINEKAHVLNVQLTSWTLVGVGIFTIIDAGCFFILGNALIDGRLL